MPEAVGSVYRSAEFDPGLAPGELRSCGNGCSA
jgi:hypothetical protein